MRIGNNNANDAKANWERVDNNNPNNIEADKMATVESSKAEIDI